jgi:hypothetical protein
MATVVHTRELALQVVSPRLVVNDTVLTPTEKSIAIQNYNIIIAEQSGIVAQAVLYGITTERTNYDTAISNLTTYLGTLVGWNVIPGTGVPIVGTTYRTNWSNVYTTKQILLNKINAIINPLLAPSGPPSPPASISVTTEPFGIRVTVGASPSEFVSHYEFRLGPTSWDSSGIVEQVSGTSILYRVLNVNTTYTFRVKAVNTLGQYSTEISQGITINGGTVTGLAYAVFGTSINLGWTGTAGSFALTSYKIKYGASWAAGTDVGIFLINSYTTTVNWLGNRTYWIATIDANGNEGTPVSLLTNINAPSAVIGARTEVVDNNILLYWDDVSISTDQLDISHYDVRKGSTYAGSALIGSNSNSTFTSIFEQASGSYTYWITATDVAGNLGPTTVSTTATVNQPPDYVFRNNYDSDLNGGDPAGLTVTNTLTNFYLEQGKLLGPVDTSASWTTHYTGNSWTTPDAQIAAGYPIYNNPSLTTGTYEEIIDYGSTIPATVITATLNTLIITGSVTVTPTISWKLNVTDSWTLLTAGLSSALIAADFRYVRISYVFTCTAGANLIRINSLNVKLAVKLRNDSGFAAGTSNYTTGGIVITFSYPFVAADTPIVQPNGATPLLPIVIYTATPNPTTFTVRLYTAFGTELAAGQSYNFSWTVRGY